MFISVDSLADDLLEFQTGSDHFAMYRVRNTDIGRAILQLAAGKRPESIAEGADLDVLKSAAVKFVRDVMLSPSSDHYALLGVAIDADGHAIRDQFRRLMGLVHPDARPVDFPPDAATRTNQAYAVLADADQRTAYTRELFDPPASASAVKKRGVVRTVETGRRIDGEGLGARLASFAQIFRSRSTLLWLAVLLLAPLGIWISSLFSRDDPARLVEARPKLQTAASLAEQRTSPSSSVTGAVVSPPVTTGVEAAAGAEVAVNQRELQAAAAAPVRPVVAAGEKATAPTPRSNLSPARQALPEPVATASKDRAPAALMSNQLSDRSIALSARSNARTASPPVAVNLAPTPSAPVSATSPEVSSRPASAREPGAPSSPSVAAPVAAPASNATTTTARSDSGDRAESANRVRTADADEILVRFTNAYETGSINGFAQLLSPAMAGRRQMLSEYERVFSATRQRSIKFNQLKHTANGDRLATSGYAVVTTVDQDNRTTTQRVFLEFEIGRERGEPRIERLANYVLH